MNPATKAMELKDWYAPTNWFWLRKRDLDMDVTGPVFDYKGKEYTVQSSKECRIWLLETAALGGEDHQTPVYRTPLVCNEEVQFASAGIWGALSTWEDSTGTRWIIMPFWGPKHSKFTAPIEHGEVVHGAVAAFKLGEKLGTLQLTPAWLSRDMYQGEPAVIANGVVFGYGSGENTTQSTPDIGLAFNSAANRVARSSRTRRSMRSTRKRATSSGPAATRSPRSITSPSLSVANGASTSAHMTASCIASGWTTNDDGHSAQPSSLRDVRGGLSRAAAGAGPRQPANGPTSGYDAQRSAWLRNDARLTADAVKKGEFAFLWKMKFENEPRQLSSLTTPIILDRLIGVRGFKALAFIGGSRIASSQSTPISPSHAG
jgi:hypothetical protein